MRLKITTLLLLAALAITDLSAQAQPMGLNLNVQPSPLIQLSVAMDRGKFGASYAIGERAQLFYTVSASQAASCVYVTFFDVTASGTVHQIFPNAYSANNCVAANVQHVLPDRASYELSIVAPAGQEVIQGVASFVPLNLNLVGGQFPLLGATLEQARQRLLSAIDALNNAPIATDATAFQVLGTPFPSNSAPVACFQTTPALPVPGQTVWFDASCAFDPDADGFIASYSWDLDGDGLFESSGRSVSWSYATPGERRVTLRVFDAQGASNTTARTVVTVAAFPIAANPNFAVTLIDQHSVRLSVIGNPRWTSAHPFQVFVQNDGFFTVAAPQARGFAFHNGVTTTPTMGGGEQLNLSGQLGAGGRVDYFITFSSTSTALRFDLRLDLDGDSFPEQVPTDRIVGPLNQHPFSNPFVIRVG